MPVTKSYLQRIPFIRITSLFLIGFLINQSLRINFQWTGILLIPVISVLILLWHNKHFSRVKIHNLLTALGILLSGMLYSGKIIEKQHPTYHQKDYFVAEICQKPIEKPNSWQSILRIQSRWSSKHEKAIVYFSKDNFDTTLIAGDQLILLAQPQAIQNRGNPFEFDFRNMMHHRGINYSIYLPQGAYKKTGIKINRISYWAEQVRERLVGFLETTNIEKEELAVISALTLGYRAELDQETYDYFINTGTIHVLSVSGLHVALLFFILSFIFSGINRGKIGKILSPLLVILFLWGYAFITGFSPPIQRSTIMFTFVIVGSILSRPVNIFNSLTASAMALLLLDPNVLYDVGFQLSYLAIFGIVLLQPILEKLTQYKNKMMKWAWTLLTVSLAAQIMTFPLSILYFNQFPNLFWLSNYFAIPGTTVLMWLTFVFFVFSPFPVIANLLSHVIQFTTHLMLIILKWMSELPLAVTRGIVLNPLQTCIIYGIVTAFIIYGFSKNRAWMFGGFVFFILLQTSLLWNKINLFNQKEIYVYNSKNNIIQLINGRNNYIILVGSSAISEQEKDYIRNVSNHLKLKKPRLLQLRNNDYFETDDLKINGKTFQFLNCRINYSNQLKFDVKGFNINKFKIDNPLLANSGMLNETTIPSAPSSDKEFSISFKTKFKEFVYISLE